MADSLFTKIINGEIPSHKVYEDDQVYAFLNIYPITTGHTLVIPKKQVEFVWDLDDETYRAVMVAAKSIALRLRDVLEVPYVGVKVVGVHVPHAHVHLVPFHEPKAFNQEPDESKEPDHGALAALAERLRF